MSRDATSSTSSTKNDIDEFDEIGAGEQLVLIWCDTHGDYEWHWESFEDLPFR